MQACIYHDVSVELSKSAILTLQNTIQMLVHLSLSSFISLCVCIYVAVCVRVSIYVCVCTLKSVTIIYKLWHGHVTI